MKDKSENDKARDKFFRFIFIAWIVTTLIGAFAETMQEESRWQRLEEVLTRN